MSKVEWIFFGVTVLLLPAIITVRSCSGGEMVFNVSAVPLWCTFFSISRVTFIFFFPRLGVLLSKVLRTFILVIPVFSFLVRGPTFK